MVSSKSLLSDILEFPPAGPCKVLLTRRLQMRSRDVDGVSEV